MEKTIAVARVRGDKTGFNQAIEMTTAADIVHLFALAMGYKPSVAFALGVISRSVPEVKSGEGYLSIEGAKKAIALASLISYHRVNNSLPENPNDCEQLLAATGHLHNIESAYTALLETVPQVQHEFDSMYHHWCIEQKQRARCGKRTGFLRRLTNFIARR